MAATLGQTLKQFEKIAARGSGTAIGPDLTALHAKLAQSAQQIETERNTLIAERASAQAQATELRSELTALRKDHERQAARAADLEKRLALVEDVTTAKPLDIVASFKNVVDQAHAEARNAPGIATTIKSLDVEIRGIVQMSADGTSPMLVFPSAKAQIDPAAFSTMRVSFAAVPGTMSPAASPVARPR